VSDSQTAVSECLVDEWGIKQVKFHPVHFSCFLSFFLSSVYSFENKIDALPTFRCSLATQAAQDKQALMKATQLNLQLKTWRFKA
jgi:hypothetical protein